jgi:hypothetical protein
MKNAAKTAYTNNPALRSPTPHSAPSLQDSTAPSLPSLPRLSTLDAGQSGSDRLAQLVRTLACPDARHGPRASTASLIETFAGLEN